MVERKKEKREREGGRERRGEGRKHYYLKSKNLFLYDFLQKTSKKWPIKYFTEFKVPQIIVHEKHKINVHSFKEKGL